MIFFFRNDGFSLAQIHQYRCLTIWDVAWYFVAQSSQYLLDFRVVVRTVVRHFVNYSNQSIWKTSFVVLLSMLAVGLGPWSEVVQRHLLLRLIMVHLPVPIEYLQTRKFQVIFNEKINWFNYIIVSFKCWLLLTSI